MTDIKREIDLLHKDFISKRKRDRLKQSKIQQKSDDKETEKIENRYFDLIKNCTILSGTIFASSIALATGKNVNNLFIDGELFLLIATIVGISYLWVTLRGRQQIYFMLTASRMKLDLKMNSDIMEDFEKKANNDLADRYQKLSEKKSLFEPILRLVKIDWYPTIFFISLCVGLMLVWASLIKSSSPPPVDPLQLY